MRCLPRRSIRTGFAFLLLATLLLTSGCASFNHDWAKAAQQPVLPNDLQGCWEGTWQSAANGHTDSLRCVMTRKADGWYQARFHAKYRRVMSFGYTVPLKVEQTNGLFQFSGEANLGWLEGGVYNYEGHADVSNYFSTYRCKYDHGTFHMGRPGSATSASDTSPATALKSSRQMLLVTTGDWNSVRGSLRRFERPDASAAWREIAGPVPVVVGRNGLGWGNGLNPPTDRPGPVKAEGDGRSPAGIFRLSSAFGLEPANEVQGLKLPYQPLGAMIECVDDVKSAHYNSIVDRGQIGQPDWTSSEKMRAVGEQYRLGVVVDHNVAPRLAAGGSCIFLHIWQDAQTGTSGCTAMASAQMDGLIAWLDPSAHPVLVQLPEIECRQLQQAWQLPEP